MNKDLPKTEKKLWQDYLFVTREMTKCLTRDDFPLFEEMLKQRDHIQLMIDQCRKQRNNDTGFCSEQDRREQITAVQAANAEVHRAFRLYQNARRQHSNAAMAYEGLDNPLLGARMDKQR